MYLVNIGVKIHRYIYSMCTLVIYCIVTIIRYRPMTFVSWALGPQVCFKLKHCQRFFDAIFENIVRNKMFFFGNANNLRTSYDGLKT